MGTLRYGSYGTVLMIVVVLVVLGTISVSASHAFDGIASHFGHVIGGGR